MRTWIEIDGKKIFFINFNRARKAAKKEGITQVFQQPIVLFMAREWKRGKVLKEFYENKIFTYSV